MDFAIVTDVVEKAAQSVPTLFRGIDLIGVFANAMLGGVLARSAKLDLVGFATLAVLSGLGGGIIRDTLMQQGPPVAFTHSSYILTALAGAVLAYLVNVEGKLWDRSFGLIDALALGTWAAAGAYKAASYDFPWVACVFLGTITAVGGGFARDVVLRRVPSVLGGNTLYATCATVASAVMVVMYEMGWATLGMIVATLVGAGFALIARRRNWILPAEYEWTMGILDRDQRWRQFIHRVRQRTKLKKSGPDDEPPQEISASV